MPLDFPSSPITGATYSAPNGTIWVWDGAKWANGVYIGTAYAPINAPTFTGDARAVTPAVGDADTSVATTAFVAAAVSPALNGVGRNYLHNPLFNVAQRGAGPFTTSVYTLDRWVLNVTTDAASVSQAAMGDPGRAAIGDEEANYYLSNTFTGNAAAGAFTQLYQRIENVRRLGNKTVTVSFWAIAQSGTPKLGINLIQNFGSGGSPSASVQALATGIAVTPTATWARYSATIVMPSVAGKTFGTTLPATDFTALQIWYSSGATNNAIAGNIGVQSGVVNIWGVQLEVGSVMTPLEKPDPQQDLAKCQRMFCVGRVYFVGYNTTTTLTSIGDNFPVTMRAVPTIVVTTQASTNLTTPGATALTTQRLYTTGTTTATGQVLVDMSYTASADL